MKKKLALLLSLGLCVSTMTVTASAEEEKTYKIGVCQLMEHDALDATYNGFVEGLKEAGYEEGKNLEIDLNNAQGDQSNCATIASKLKNDGCDLIFAIATPAAQACANEITDTPILISAVTDPAASGLVDSNEAPGANITGTSDLTPVASQIEMIQKLVPDAKTVGVFYTSSETNSKLQADMAIEAGEKLGYTMETYTVSQSSEIQQVVESMVGKIDALYIPTDNLLASNMPTVSMVANQAKIPTICGESGMVENGGLITNGINYFDLGVLTGKQAAEILEGADPATMPIEYCPEDSYTYTVNEDTAAEIGIEIPEEFLQDSEEVETEASTDTAEENETESESAAE